jgi:hypothetical protein
MVRNLCLRWGVFKIEPLKFLHFLISRYFHLFIGLFRAKLVVSCTFIFLVRRNISEILIRDKSVANDSPPIRDRFWGFSLSWLILQADCKCLLQFKVIDTLISLENIVIKHSIFISRLIQLIYLVKHNLYGFRTG